MRVTLEEVARKAGVSKATASKALAGDTRISEETRARVRAAAEAEGYAPNPLVAALMSQLRGGRRRDESPVIAVVNPWPRKWRRMPGYGEVAAGAEGQARRRRFQLEEFPWPEDERQGRRLADVLASRGVHGVLVPQVPEHRAHLALDLRRLAAATVGPSLHSPELHRASPDLNRAAEVASEEMRLAGARRIGLVVRRVQMARLGGGALTVFRGHQWEWPDEDRIPALVLEENEDDTRLRAWMKRWRPDAILSHDGWLKVLREIAPQETWLTSLSGDGGLRLAHVDIRHGEVGRLAVDLIVEQLYRRETGVPEVRRTVTLTPRWSVPRGARLPEWVRTAAV